MTTWNGWAETILNVGLNNMKVSKESLSMEFATKYIGGSGFGARVLYDEVPHGDNALEPENVIIIGQGPLSGTAAPANGGGGFFVPEMKLAGYDLTIIRGKAEKPVYLWVDDERAELRDATHLWGKDIWTTQRMIQDKYYRLRGCDLETGIPARETLEAHSLKDVADDLASCGILPTMAA